MPGLPQSLRSQFMLGIVSLSLLIVAIGMAAIYALRNGSDAAQRLALQQLEHAQQSQQLALHARAVKRELERLMASTDPGQLEHSHGVLIDQIRLLEALLNTRPVADEGLPQTSVLDGARQLRASIEHLRALSRASADGGMPPSPDDALRIATQRTAVTRRSEALLAGALQHAADHERAYRAALQALVEHSTGNQRGIVLLLVIALLFTWMVASLFLGRHLLLRLQQVSRHLRSDKAAAHAPLAALTELTEGGDEIAEMARAVRHLLADREALQARTAELSAAKEALTEQGRVLEMMAHHDALTGLPNRALLNDRLAQALAQARRSGRPLALLFLDLDGFKDINDSLGHASGDRLLQSVAERLRTLVREGDTVARLGGDEFVVMLVNLAQAGDAVAIARAIAQALARPHPVDGHTLHITASIGVAAFPDDGDSAEALLKHADVAMYRAKALGRNAVQLYTRDMSVHARQRVELQGALHEAIERGQLELHYQPQLELASGRLRGVEALIRWQHPQLGPVSPERFIPLAEETGLIAPLGEWVLRTAARQLQRWRAAGHTTLTLAVNLSARQVEAPGLPRLVQQVLDECELPAPCLELEITETALLHNADPVLTTLQALKDVGVALALDDFGTGYSSLAHLRRFPIDTIKIDKSFTAEIGASADTATIIRAIVTLARSLGVETVAEGVETAPQLRFLAMLGCHHAQGYHLGRPVPAAAIDALLALPASAWHAHGAAAPAAARMA
jgi:diguanylate cyclase (GGDEF)-like protein